MGLLTVITVLVITFGFGLYFGNGFGLRGGEFAFRDYLQLFLIIPLAMIIVSVIRGDWLIVVFGLILLVAGFGTLGATLPDSEDEDDAHQQDQPRPPAQEIPLSQPHPVQPEPAPGYDNDQPPVF